MVVGLGIVALYFAFIASNEANNNGSNFGSGGGGSGIGASTLQATGVLTDTPMATLSVEQTPTP
jgi:hypothetical protein